MQLNAVYKWLSVSVWACCSCKRAPLLGRTRTASRREEAGCRRWWREMNVSRPQEFATVENRKPLLPSRVTTAISLNMWVVVRRALPSQLLRSVVMMFWGWFTSCLKEGNYLGRRFKKIKSRSLSAKGTFLLNVTEIHRLPSVWRVIQKIWMASGGVRKSQNTLAINWGCRLKRGTWKCSQHSYKNQNDFSQYGVEFLLSPQKTMWILPDVTHNNCDFYACITLGTHTVYHYQYRVHFYKVLCCRNIRYFVRMYRY